jgi:hypothetical protein
MDPIEGCNRKELSVDAVPTLRIPSNPETEDERLPVK